MYRAPNDSIQFPSKSTFSITVLIWKKKTKCNDIGNEEAIVEGEFLCAVFCVNIHDLFGMDYCPFEGKILVCKSV